LAELVIRAAIDTSTLTLSLALECDGDVVCSRRTFRKAGHSRILTQEFDAMLSARDLEPADLDELVVGVGPGSFTGLRIGMAFARGLSRSLSIPIFGRYSFAGFAAVLPPGNHIACAIDARKREVYGAIWTTGRNARRLVPETTWKPQRFLEVCDGYSRSGRLVLAGNGFQRYEAVFGQLMARYGEIPRDALSPSAEGLLTWNSYPYEPSGLEPLYIRPSEAELGSSRRS
jgi:tRNA threonylcarbamoyladenosine biosynthesis protein TsaB